MKIILLLEGRKTFLSKEKWLKERIDIYEQIKKIYIVKDKNKVKNKW